MVLIFNSVVVNNYNLWGSIYAKYNLWGSIYAKESRHLSSGEVMAAGQCESSVPG
jgi:hypothetical protein